MANPTGDRFKAHGPADDLRLPEGPGPPRWSRTHPFCSEMWRDGIGSPNGARAGSRRDPRSDWPTATTRYA